MARKIFTSRTKTKKFPSHVFPNAKPPFLQTDVYGIGEVKKSSNHVETFDRFRASLHCGRIPRQPRSKYAIKKKYNIAQRLIRDHCTAFCDMTIGLFLRRTDVYIQMGYEHGIPSSDF
ncbi:DUF1661 domain-containing protein [Porphyromonas gingivalis]|uniref:DUF1661 domain-containing protein n=1 Tax=Porphyromonas gingivalis TaxID=837 RepID=UPI00351C47F6